jgi:hypothetical protein
LRRAADDACRAALVRLKLTTLWTGRQPRRRRDQEDWAFSAASWPVSHACCVWAAPSADSMAANWALRRFSRA